MTTRTYIPELKAVLSEAHRYATRWQPKLEAGLTTEQYNCLVATIEAIAACLVILPVDIVNP
jgi:hypothetical protein